MTQALLERRQRLLWAEAVGGSAQALKAARYQLVLQLAAALEDDWPLRVLTPSTDGE